MARLKSRYRKYAAGGAVTEASPISPAITVDIDREPAVNGGLSPKHDQVLDDGLAHLSHIVERDDASVAFQKQIDELRRAETAQHQRNDEAARHAARMAEVNEILKANPDMVRNADELVRAEKDAYAEGHEPYSPEFHRAVIRNFKEYMAMKAPAPVATTGSEFEPSYAPSGRGVGSMVSAPVSRDIPDGRSYSERSDSRVTLSAEERDMARRSGISEREYAEGKLRMQQEKRDGIRQ